MFVLLFLRTTMMSHNPGISDLAAAGPTRVAAALCKDAKWRQVINCTLTPSNGIYTYCDLWHTQGKLAGVFCPLYELVVSCAAFDQNLLRAKS